MTKIQLICMSGVVRIAVIKEQNLLDFGVWYPGHSDGFGDIYLGRVDSCLTALGGAFITLGKNLSGFLPENAGAKGLHEGDWIIVRVTRSHQGGKGLRLDGRNIPPLTLPKDKTPELLQAGPSLFEELAQRWHNADIISDELNITNLIPASYKSRVHLAKEPIDPEIMEQIDALETNEVALPMGMRASITPTPALVAIDMDTATQSNDNQNKLRSQFNANQLALPQLLHQLKLRNLSGAIIVDLAGLPIKKRRLFQREFEQALQNDPLHPKFLGFTNLGLAEITRPRKRPPLHEVFSCDHGQAIQILGNLERKFKSLASPHQYQQITLILSIPLYQALQNDQWAVNHFEKRCTISLSIESNPSFTTCQWEYQYA
ncbi:ribonuclease E/G [Commensalibacter papalotli (ex Botero et al. 2024)]|uniref:Ribonuclease G or E (CafA) (PDB:1SLJ) n=1 Tax=Commensalibacter papalotli (ex Botero et al. 2024) TaxID=2972766 RepID=A0ABN8WAA2_9PROT|nr:ribonuclease E/G [Commensalibacter papalotli (ex Botero et al. 2024)]CAI3935342.1 Ribonuclease G or E (CafA) (PDB:1SLJ) [Commensalibacter papalotli (ex Botero et al. 2024)]CAI3951484.1 Ribonuclease G or E (CafA) (PDB:1SLJ) [Commensalibacter papalotli (ex Botero et al. 2024)]